MQRLQKVLSQAGVCSRRHAEQLIEAGRVRVNGAVVTELGSRVDAESAHIEVDGRVIRVNVVQTCLLLNKPDGVVCTMSDPEGRRTVAELLGPLAVRLVPVGRLDYHTTGVLLMTNDGALAAAMAHPRTADEKVYRLKVRGAVDQRALDRLRESIWIDGKRTQPATVVLQTANPQSTVFRVTLREGRNRQIRRLAEHAGLQVTGLERTHFAGLTAAGLRRGQWRELSTRELRDLRNRYTPSPHGSGQVRP